MAAAEARAFWQRTANRYFVQEDAKRAPALAFCQSATCSDEVVDSGVTHAQCYTCGSSMPLYRNPFYANLPPDSRWWLHLRSENVHQKVFTQEKPMKPESEIEDSNMDKEIPCAVRSVESTFYEFNRSEESEAFSCESIQQFVDLMERREICGFMGLEKDFTGYLVSGKPDKLSHDLGKVPWVSSEKDEPWWRTTDKDDLASFVSRKSLDYIENCDLPTPQKLQTRMNVYGNSFGGGESLFINRKSGSSCVLNSAPNFSDYGKTLGSGRASMEMHLACNESPSVQYEASVGEQAEKDFSKVQLPEALCRSQTRARVAEKAAKEAYAEKDHIMNLFFRQALQLFAYKQWFRLLRLEALYLRRKNAEHSVSSVVTEAIPSISRKPRKSERRKAGRTKRPGMATYCMAFALGLSLIGAGLLLGWTVGWMLPF